MFQAPASLPVPPMRAVDAVSAPILQGFPELVAELGGDGHGLMRESGIDPDTIRLDIACPNYRQMVDLLERAAAALDCPDFGLRLGYRQCITGIRGPLGRVMRHARTFGDALDAVARHGYAHSLSAGIWLRPTRSGTGMLFGHDILLEGLPSKAQAMEQMLLIGHLSALRLTGGAARARRIHFRHQRLSPMRTYRAYFGCEVRFGQRVNATRYDSADLATPIVAADPAAFHSAIVDIQRAYPDSYPPITIMARGIILHALGTERCHQDAVAQEIGLHPRTFQRRLAEEGTSFRAIRDEVRHDMMAYYLAHTDLDFAQISERLGFSEQSVLTRFCHKRCARSPTRLRAETGIA